MTEVQWPDRRQDVINSLEALTTLTPSNTEAWPDLTNAIHWFVDDTGWDRSSPYEHIGLILRDGPEAAAISSVLEPLLAVLDQIGPDKPDRDYLSNKRWPHVRVAAGATHDLLIAGDR